MNGPRPAPQKEPRSRPESDFPEKMSNPARQALAAAGYWKLEQLAALSEAELLRLHGLGPKTIVQLRQALAEKGLSFAPVRQTRKG